MLIEPDKQIAREFFLILQFAHVLIVRLLQLILPSMPSHSLLLRPFLSDPSNVVRCTALEGLGILSESEPTLQTEVTLVLEEALQTGTLAMKNRAQHALKKMANRSSFTVKKRKETMRSK